MMHEFCTSKTKSIVLGDWPENPEESIEMALSRIEELICDGSIIPSEEDGPFLLKRSEYDLVKKCFIREPEYLELKISTVDGEISAEIMIAGF